MNKKADKAQLSEFDQKLQESMSGKRESISTDDSLTSSRDDVTTGDTFTASEGQSTYRDADRREMTNRVEDDFPRHQEYETIPVIEEQVKLDKKVVETSRVNISKKVHHEQVSVDIPTIDEEVEVTRVEVNQVVDSEPPAIRYEGDKMIIPVLREVSVVVKRLMLVEELHVTKRRVETSATQQVTLRKEEVTVNRTDITTNNRPDAPDQNL